MVFVAFNARVAALRPMLNSVRSSYEAPLIMVHMTLSEIKRIIEALILCHDAPMSLPQIRQSLESDLSNEQLRVLLEEIAAEWRTRGVNLVQVASGWRFQSAADLLPYLDRMRAEKPATYSRAVLETLAIIAYRQPVTRGDIEDIRGVTVSSEIIKKLEERGWIDVVGHREVPGRPALFATTKHFLDDLGLQGLRDLPPLLAPTESDDEPQLSLDGVKQLTQVIENHAAADAESAEPIELLELAHSDAMHVVVSNNTQNDTQTEIQEENYYQLDEPTDDELADLAILDQNEIPVDLSETLDAAPSDEDITPMNRNADSPPK